MSSEVKPRRKYDREFKIQAVKLLLKGEKTTKEIAEQKKHFNIYTNIFRVRDA
jgi:transposase-like protein